MVFNTLTGNTMTAIFNFLFLILLKQLTGLNCTIPDPCPDIKPSTNVADMCSDNYAIGKAEDGSNAKKSSVVVRVMHQTDNCICNASADSQNLPVILYIRKYNNLNSTAPEQENCGLEVGVTYYQEKSNVSNSFSMTCTTPLGQNSVPLLKNGIVSLISNVTDGNFTRGYCIEITIDKPNLTLGVICGNPGLLPSTLLPQPTTTTTTSILSSSEQSETTDYKSNHTFTQTKWTSKETTSTKATEAVQNIDQEKSSVLYIAIGSSAGFMVILFIAIITVYRRKKKTKTQERQNDDDIYDQDGGQHYDGLKDNVLYVSSEQQDNLELDYSTVNSDSPLSTQHEGSYKVVDDGHYSTANDELQHLQIPPIPRSKPYIRTSESNFSLPDSSNGNDPPTHSSNVYAVVNKKEKDNVKEIVDKSEEKEIFANGQNETYAVVDKSMKHISAGGDKNTNLEVINPIFQKE